MTDLTKPWLSGEPYYCKKCGLGFAGYVACEDSGCELESKEEAMKRRHDAGAPKTNKPALMGREEIEIWLMAYRNHIDEGGDCHDIASVNYTSVWRFCQSTLAAHDIYDNAIEDAAQKCDSAASIQRSALTRNGGAVADQCESLGRIIRKLKGTSNG